jgi:XTP/dITP diphosphohydrolase
MLTFLTGNKNKIKEVSSVLGDTFITLDIDLPEIQSVAYEDVIKAKLVEARKHIKEGAIFVEDAGYVFEALGKLPGPFSKFFIQELGREGLYNLVSKLGNTRAVHTTNIGYMDEKGEVIYFTTKVEGNIVSPRGSEGFAYDPIFVPDGHTKTFAEMSDEERFAVKPRVAATKLLKEYLERQ